VSAAFSLGPERLLAVRAEAEKFELVRHGFETVGRRDAPLNVAGETFRDLDNLRAFDAHQMMVVAVVAFADEFKPRRAVTKIKALDHAHGFEQVH